MNAIWLFLLVVAFAFSVVTGKVGEFSSGAFEWAQKAFEVALSLVGIMTFWLGLMKVAEKSGLVNLLARAVYPVLGRLFPDVPRDHPALTAIAMNVAANALGLDNAATPLGLKAMEELDKLNPKKGVLSDAQAMLVSINTAGLALVPVTVIALRAAEKSKDPYEIVVPTLLSTGFSLAFAVLVSKLMARRQKYRDEYAAAEDKAPGPPKVGGA